MDTPANIQEEPLEQPQSTVLPSKSILDAFGGLTNLNGKHHIDCTLQLLKHASKRPEFKVEMECRESDYILKRLTRGLGSSSETPRKGFYVAYAAFISKFKFIPMDKILEIIDKELEVCSSSKREKGEVYFGRLLAFGAIIRSARFEECKNKQQKEIISDVLNMSSQKSYLPQLASPFLAHLIDKSDAPLFSKAIWPAFKPWLCKPWNQQSLDSLYIILKISCMFPKAVKETELKKLLGAPTFISMSNLADISNVLFNTTKVMQLHHPVYEEICKNIAMKPELIMEFWQSHVDSLLLSHKNSRYKGSLALTIFRLLLEHLQTSEKIPDLLTVHFITLLRQRLTRVPFSEGNFEELRAEANATVAALIKSLTHESVSDQTRALCLEKIVTSCRGEFGFDQITKCNAVHSIVTTLKEEKGLVQVSDLCTAVISGESHPGRADDEESNDSLPTTWLNKDRIAAVKLLVNLCYHTSASVDFKLKQLLFLAEHAFFPPAGCSSLCSAAKDAIMGCLNIFGHKKSSVSLVVLKKQLKRLTIFLDAKIAKGMNPIKSSKEVLEVWTDTLTAIKKLDQKKRQAEKSTPQYRLVQALQILYMFLGIQLFIDPDIALDALKDFHSCMEKVEYLHQNSSKVAENEPAWIEVVTELLLALLSQNCSSLRGIVGKVFSALTGHVTENALLLLLNVLDINSSSNPLSVRSEMKNGELSDSEEESSVDIENSEEEATDDSNDEEETVSDKLRAAVRVALGDAAETTDVESIDVDDISEEEGNRLDNALSQAFSTMRSKSITGVKGSLTKKQWRDQNELLHFRVRVLDLIELYIQSEQSLRLTLGLIVPLFQYLETCLKAPNQKPLESKLRHCLQKFSSVKKFENTSGVNLQTLAGLLKSLIQKGDRTAAVFIDISKEVCTVCSCIVRVSRQLTHTFGDNNPVETVYTTALKMYLRKRECLLPKSFFSEVLKTYWMGNFALFGILDSALSVESHVRPFQKLQAVALLKELASNYTLMSRTPRMLKLFAYNLCYKVSETFEKGKNLKERYLAELVSLINFICTHYLKELDSGLRTTLNTVCTDISAEVRKEPLQKSVAKALGKWRKTMGIDMGEIDYRIIWSTPKSDAGKTGEPETSKRKSKAQVQNSKKQKLQ